MDRTRLVRKVITDKNGKKTVVWVKPVENMAAKVKRTIADDERATKELNFSDIKVGSLGQSSDSTSDLYMNTELDKDHDVMFNIWGGTSISINISRKPKHGTGMSVKHKVVKDGWDKKDPKFFDSMVADFVKEFGDKELNIRNDGTHNKKIKISKKDAAKIAYRLVENFKEYNKIDSTPKKKNFVDPKEQGERKKEQNKIVTKLMEQFGAAKLKEVSSVQTKKDNSGPYATSGTSIYKKTYKVEGMKDIDVVRLLSNVKEDFVKELAAKTDHTSKTLVDKKIKNVSFANGKLTADFETTVWYN